MQPVPNPLLRWQFDLTWTLAEVHLTQLRADDFLREPGPLCWTMRPPTDGRWTPDWADTEPHPIPVPTIGWVTWHLGWWWTVTIDHLRGGTPHNRTDVTWPGPDRTVDWLRGLHTEWTAVLDDLTDAALNAPAPFPWPADSGLTVAHTVAWVNAELMKNVAELGQLRLQRAAAA